MLWTTEAQKDHRRRRSDRLEFPIRSRLPPRAEAAAARSASGWDATQEPARQGGFQIAAGGQKNITGCRRWHKSSVKGCNDRHTCAWVPAQAALDLSALLFTVGPFLFFFSIRSVDPSLLRERRHGVVTPPCTRTGSSCCLMQRRPARASAFMDRNART